MQPGRGIIAKSCPSLSQRFLAVFVVANYYRVGASDTLPECSCDCCEAELQNSAAGEDSRFECVKSQPILVAGRAYSNACPEQCSRSPADLVLSAAVDQDVDTERFCFFECAPKAHAKDGPYPGDPCRPLAAKETRSVVDETGNALPPMAQPEVMSSFLVDKRSLQYQGAAAPAASPAGAGGKPSAEPWSSAIGRAPEESARITELGQEASKKSAEAQETSGTSIVKVNRKGSAALPVALAAVEDARRAAGEARQHELNLRTLRDRALLVARREALGLVPGILKELETVWHTKARAWALKQRDAAQKRMIADAPLAAEAAAAPYGVAKKNAELLANEYARRAKELTTQSTQLQAMAQQYRDEANRLRVDNMPQAQRMYQKALDLQKRAQDSEDQAGSFYAQAQSIKDVTIPQYSKDAAQTARHAEVLVNPDAPMPLPPIDAPIPMAPII